MLSLKRKATITFIIGVTHLNLVVVQCQTKYQSEYLWAVSAMSGSESLNFVTVITWCVKRKIFSSPLEFTFKQLQDLDERFLQPQQIIERTPFYSVVTTLLSASLLKSHISVSWCLRHQLFFIKSTNYSASVANRFKRLFNAIEAV